MEQPGVTVGTGDILREAIAHRPPGTLIIGFAAETGDLLANARAKLEKKGADAIAFRLAQPKAMYDGHDWWLSALKARSERTAHPAAPAPKGVKN